MKKTFLAEIIILKNILFDQIWLKSSFFDRGNPMNFDQIWLKSSFFDRVNFMILYQMIKNRALSIGATL